MHMTNEEYNEYIRKKQPRSPLGMDMLRDFLEQHVCEMHSVTLSYATEKMGPTERLMWRECRKQP